MIFNQLSRSVYIFKQIMLPHHHPHLQSDNNVHLLNLFNIILELIMILVICADV